MAAQFPPWAKERLHFWGEYGIIAMMKLFSAEQYRGKRVCVALSGGIDSVCLLHVLKGQAADMGITLSAIHIEHGIRGEESLRDMAFCEVLCKEWGVPLKIVRENVPALAAEQGGSVEQVARAVRYAAFFAVVDTGEADFVATAHHADDLAETILFRLARGTGASGMKAITERGGLLRRPLLTVTRAEIEAYADENGLPHVEDSTNKDENFTRNYIRHTVLPAFEKIHEGAKKHLVEFAALAAEEDDYLQKLAEEKIVRVFDEEWVPADLPDVLFARACLSCLRQTGIYDYTRANLEELARLKTAQSGKKVSLPVKDVPWRRVAIREGKYVVFYWDWDYGEEGFAEIPFSPQEGLYTRPAAFSVQEFGAELPAGAGAAEKGSGKRALFVDLDAFPAGCVVRTRREGDIITPYHARKKTLKKFLTDKKIPARLSQKLPVIAKGSEVFVVVGVEISDSVKVKEETVRRGLIRF